MGKKISIEVGLCTKEMAKENPVKDFEILIEEYKDKWSKQMYDYFKECLNEIKKKLKAFEIIKKKQVNVFGLHLSKPYWSVNDYNELIKLQYDRYLTQEEYDLLKEVLL